MPGEAFELPLAVDGLPPPPPESLDPYLDAAARCFTHHGIRRTKVQDVARELGVNRTTVYRQVGAVDDLARLLLARELHRILGEVARRLADERGPEGITRLLADLVVTARKHRVLAKVLEDEPELIGPFLVTHLGGVVRRVSTVLAPLLEAAMARGEIADRDPTVLAEWLVRIGASVLIEPPRGALEAFLGELLVPALTSRDLDT